MADQLPTGTPGTAANAGSFFDETNANGIGYMSKAGVQGTIDVMKDYMGLKAAITPEETFDMSFLPKAGAPR